jgi:hypothetical protein
MGSGVQTEGHYGPVQESLSTVMGSVHQRFASAS